jgi:hypothetical protein
MGIITHRLRVSVGREDTNQRDRAGEVAGK